MRLTSIKKEVERLGGVATIEEKKRPNGTTYSTLKGEVLGYDVEATEDWGFYTIRSTSKRGFYDPSADYNGGDWKFLHKVKELKERAL